MSPPPPRRGGAIESCTYQLHSWRPFHLPNTLKTLDSSDHHSPKPYHSSTKRPCLSDRSSALDLLDSTMSNLTLFEQHNDNYNNNNTPLSSHSLRWIARKRRRRGSRSVSGRSSDRSGTRRRCCSVGASAAYATCSDFMVANGTDSSGELFVSVGGDVNWGSDVSEAAKGSVLRKEREVGSGGVGERESLSGGVAQIGNFDGIGNESGYGSEPGYRGDAELGYGDEFDEEEDDPRLMFWGHNFGDTDTNMEIVSENTLQKTHHRCRRKKQDIKMVDLCH